MEAEDETHVAELRLSYRYVKEHPWVVQAMNGFLSAYFMEQPGFRVQRHYDELESGMHVWLCEIPRTMKMSSLLRRLRADIPPCTYTETQPDPSAAARFLIDSPTKAEGE
ncbi:MAG TPA: hypothetical protein VLE03_02040 [Nitrospiraceae bacterium]|nr:hypothetical protein [Nitrospiraceae bacterium]